MELTLPRPRSYFQRHPAVIFVLILLVGLLPRLLMLAGPGFMGDQFLQYEWAACTQQYGIFGLYRCPVLTDHPPIGPSLMGLVLAVSSTLGVNTSSFVRNPVLIAAVKLPALFFEIALIRLVFVIANRKAGVWWAALVTALLYFNPGWTLVTAWWGQTDVIYSFFLLLTAYLLMQRRPRWMWAVYGLAWLAKFQSVMFFPLLLILSLRRQGVRATLEGLAIFAAVFGLGLLPYLLVSGRAALTPYVGVVNSYPFTTNNAFNLWFALSGSSSIPDSTLLIGGLSYMRIGLALLMVATGLLCLRAWRSDTPDEEYLLLAAMGFSFFILPTQIHERYLYPTLVFLALALIQDWRLLLLYLGMAVIFTDNILDTVWLGFPLLEPMAALMVWTPVQAALALIAEYLLTMGLVLRPLLRWRPAVLIPEKISE